LDYRRLYCPFKGNYGGEIKKTAMKAESKGKSWPILAENRLSAFSQTGPSSPENQTKPRAAPH
jgi:hypothetical protein